MWHYTRCALCGARYLIGAKARHDATARHRSERAARAQALNENRQVWHPSTKEA